jgi:glutaredoxin
MVFELFGASRCPHTKELRQWLEWQGSEFVEYDVETDAAARERMLQISNGQRTVPVLALDGRLVQVGWQGRGCIV